MATLIVLRHPVSILVSVFTIPDNFTNDIFTLKPLFIQLDLIPVKSMCRV